MGKLYGVIKRHIVSAVLVLTIVTTLLPVQAVNAQTDADVTALIDQVMNKLGYSESSPVYWNQNKSGYASQILFEVRRTPCDTGTKKGSGGCYSNTYVTGHYQCQGFAMALSEYLFGTAWNNWKYDSNVEKGVKPGDVIYTDAPTHAAVVWKVDSNGQVHVAECWGSTCKIHFGPFNGGKDKNTGKEIKTLSQINQVCSGLKIYRHPQQITYIAAGEKPTITFSGEKYPSGNLKHGDNFGIQGMVTTNVPNLEITGGVYYRDGSSVNISNVTGTTTSVNGSINLRTTLNNDVIFNNLPVGDYTFKVIARATNGTDSKGKVVYEEVVRTTDFSVLGGSASSNISTGNTNTSANTVKDTKPRLSVSSVQAPEGTLKQGSNFPLRGVISTDVGTLSITGGVYYTNGSGVDGYYKTYQVNKSSIDIATTINNYIIFNNLQPGDYVYKVTATAVNGKESTTEELINTRFIVEKSKNNPTTSTKPTYAKPTISVTGLDYPSGELKQGSSYGLRGNISTSVGKISITGGVYYTNGVAVDGFVKDYSATGTSINIRNTLNNDIIFNNLSVGEYVYKVTATAENGDQTTTKEIANSAFTVKGTTKKQPEAVTPTISSTEVNAPSGTMNKGSSFGLRGVISTDVGTISITGGVYYTNGAAVDGFVKNYSVTGTSINIKNTLNNDVIFNNLPVGDYIYKVQATAVNSGKQTSKEIVSSYFTVKEKESVKPTPEPATPNISVSGVKAPSGTLDQGSNFGLRGVVSTDVGSITITGGVYYTNGSAVSGFVNSYTQNGSIDIRYTLNDYVIFNNLPAGDYIYRVVATASNQGKTAEREVAYSTFTISGAQPAPQVEATPTITISGATYPSAVHTRGKNFGIRGTISADCGRLTYIRGYVLYPNGDLVPGFASEYDPGNTTSFDLRYTVNNDLIFNNLPAGNYRYVIAAHAANGSQTAYEVLIDYAFTVQ